MQIIGIIVALLCGYWCYTLAKKNGRNEIIAAICGVLFGLIAVLVYYILGKKK